MTNFTRRSRAEAEIAIGKGKIGISNKGRDQFGLRIPNKGRLDMARSGTKDFVSGTIKLNRIKKGLSPLKRPPSKTRKK